MYFFLHNYVAVERRKGFELSPPQYYTEHELVNEEALKKDFIASYNCSLQPIELSYEADPRDRFDRLFGINSDFIRENWDSNLNDPVPRVTSFTTWFQHINYNKQLILADSAAQQQSSVSFITGLLVGGSTLAMAKNISSSSSSSTPDIVQVDRRIEELDEMLSILKDMEDVEIARLSAPIGANTAPPLPTQPHPPPPPSAYAHSATGANATIVNTSDLKVNLVETITTVTMERLAREARQRKISNIPTDLAMILSDKAKLAAQTLLMFVSAVGGRSLWPGNPDGTAEEIEKSWQTVLGWDAVLFAENVKLLTDVHRGNKLAKAGSSRVQSLANSLDITHWNCREGITMPSVVDLIARFAEIGDTHLLSTFDQVFTLQVLQQELKRWV